jgi:hypothetical protein
MRKHLKKFYVYGADFVNYKEASTKEESGTQLGFIRKVYLRNWRKFLRHPAQGSEFILYHTAKYGAGAAGYAVGKLKSRKS